MPWLAPSAALVLAALTCALTPAVLRGLPEPEGPGAEAKIPYSMLPTRGFVAAVGAACLGAGLIAFGVLPAEYWLAWSALVSVNVLACAVDARTTWLPARLSRAGWALAAAGVLPVAVAQGSAWPLVASALGALALGGAFHLLWRVSGAFGYGDVRLAATIGAVTAPLGVELVWASVLAGTLAGALVGIGYRAGGRRGAFPYGPGLLAGPFLALLARALGG